MGLSAGEIIGLIIAGVVSIFLLYVIYRLILENFVPSGRGLIDGVKKLFTRTNTQIHQDSQKAADALIKVQRETRQIGESLPSKDTELTDKQEKLVDKTTTKYADALRRKSVAQSKVTGIAPLTKEEAQEKTEKYVNLQRRNTVISDDYRGQNAFTEEERRNFLVTGFTGIAPEGQSTSTRLDTIPEQGGQGGEMGRPVDKNGTLLGRATHKFAKRTKRLVKKLSPGRRSKKQ